MLIPGLSWTPLLAVEPPGDFQGLPPQPEEPPGFGGSGRDKGGKQSAEAPIPTASAGTPPT